jgi:hypothetical protein
MFPIRLSCLFSESHIYRVVYVLHLDYWTRNLIPSSEKWYVGKQSKKERSQKLKLFINKRTKIVMDLTGRKRLMIDLAS